MKLVNYLILALFLPQCASVKVDKNIPFTVKNAIYKVGTNELFVEYSSNKNVDFQEVFYNNRKTKAVIIQQEKKNYVMGTFKKGLLQDFNLHSDPKQEYGNVPTKTSEEKIPFELKENEAIISYKMNNEIKYHRIPSVTVM